PHASPPTALPARRPPLLVPRPQATPAGAGVSSRILHPCRSPFMKKPFSLRSRRQPTKDSRAPRRPRPALELLEDRLAPPADILVTTAGSYPQQFVKEFSPTGTLVRQLTVPPPLGSGGDTARDLVADPAGNIYVYNGTFTPSLATWNQSLGQWAQQNYPGWGTINNVS